MEIVVPRCSTIVKYNPTNNLNWVVQRSTEIGVSSTWFIGVLE